MRKSLGLLVATATLSTVFATQLVADDEVRRISVTGEGRIEAVPDMATLTLGVTSGDVEARAAMGATSAAVRRVLDRLTGMGLQERDVQTQRFSLSPVWSRREESGSGRSEITGFTASNMVLVRVRDLDRLGEILDAVIADGANDFNGLQFGLQAPDVLEDQARQAAVKDAMAKADLLAQAAGVSLGPILSMSEQGGGGPRPMMMEMAAARDGSVPVAAGEVSLTASVSMVFAIAE